MGYGDSLLGGEGDDSLSATGDNSFPADAGDLEVLVNGQEAETLIGDGSEAAQPAPMARHSLVFG